MFDKYEFLLILDIDILKIEVSKFKIINIMSMYDLNSTENKTMEPTQAVENKPEGKKRSLIIAIIVILALAVGFGLGAFYHGQIEDLIKLDFHCRNRNKEPLCRPMAGIRLYTSRKPPRKTR